MKLMNYVPGKIIINDCFISRVHGSVDVLSWTAKGRIIERKKIYKEGVVWFFEESRKKIPSHKLHDLDMDLPF